MRRTATILLLLGLLLAAAVILRLLIGPTGFGLAEPGAQQFRVERALNGALVGAALAIGGAFLQTLLRNPLASPDLIGPASGAGFAVTLSSFLLHTGSSALLTTTVHSTSAFVGAVGALALVYFLSQRRGHVNPTDLVLIGVVVNILFGAGTMLLMHLMPDQGLSIARWTIGSLSDDTATAATAAAAVIIPIAILGGLLLGPSLDAATLSDEEAISLGVPIRPLRIALFIGAGALTAAAVVIAGPVGFVGLISPHIVRLLLGPSHRPVIIGSALLGAAIVVGADAATRAISTRSGQMPIGILTAVAGGAVFIAMLRGGNPRER